MSQKLSEQLAALVMSVQALENQIECLRAQMQPETFKHIATVKEGVVQAVSTGRTVTLKIPSALQTVSFERKTAGSLEDDVRKFLGLSPYEKGKFKNDKHFIAKLDKLYGAEMVDAMIKQLRGA